MLYKLNFIAQVGDLPILNQVFGEVTHVSDMGQYDGIFGLGYPSISTTDNKQSPLDRMKEQGLIKERSFCFILHHYYDEKVVNEERIGGELQIGGCEYQPTKYMPLIKDASWTILMSEITVNRLDDTQFRACSGECQALIDTGTTLILGPEEEILEINKIIGARKNNETDDFDMDCYTNNLPNITFMMDDTPFVLTPKDYILTWLMNWEFKCESAFQSWKNDSWIIGVVFLRTTVTVFDMDNNRIGFAPKPN